MFRTNMRIYRAKKRKRNINKEMKPYKDMMVDADLSCSDLDAINSLKDIQISSVCSGHGNKKATLIFTYRGDKDISNVLKILYALPNIKVKLRWGLSTISLHRSKLKNVSPYAYFGSSLQKNFVLAASRANKTWLKDIYDCFKFASTESCNQDIDQEEILEASSEIHRYPLKKRLVERIRSQVNEDLQKLRNQLKRNNLALLPPY